MQIHAPKIASILALCLLIREYRSIFLVFLAAVRIMKAGRGSQNAELLRTCGYWCAASIILSESVVPAILFAGLILAFNNKKDEGPLFRRDEIAISFVEERNWKREQNVFSATALLLLTTGGQYALSIIAGVLAIEASPNLMHRPPLMLLAVTGLFLSSSCGLWKAIVAQDVSRSLHAALFHLAFAGTLNRPYIAAGVPLLYTLF